MEYILEKEQKVKKLSGNEKQEIAKKIADEFKVYDRGRSAQIDKAEKIKDEIFFKNVAKKVDDKGKEWKSNVKLCKAYMYYQIIKAFIWKNTYANTQSMFDVSGESQESDNNSNKWKMNLVDIFEKMEYSKTMDKIIDNSLIYGELISFTTWKKINEEYRRPISFFDGVKEPSKLLKIAKAVSKGEKFYIDERQVYNNPYIYAVDPANFVYDTTQKDNWDKCPKINRTWKTPNDIINNKYYEISEEAKKDIKELVKHGSDESDVSDISPESNKEEIVKGSTVEVLEHWGNLTLKDGTVLENWYAVVVAGKYLVRFEKNPFIINPFSIGAYITDPDNGRGIGLLYSIYDLMNVQEDMLRRTMDMQSLSENPPVYAPKGFFGEDPSDVELNPGKIIEYDQGLYNQIPVKQMEFAVTVFQNDISYLDDVMCEISGIFPNMAGQSESDRTTATEISTKVEGQITRLKLLLDVINQYLILDNVKKVAKLKANFTFGDESIFVTNTNEPKEEIITNDIRQADYKYTYSDRSATSERFNYVDMVAQSMQMFIKGGLQANIQEIFTWYMEQKGVENPERFLAMDLIDPQVQQALLQNEKLKPIIQEMQKRVEMAKQGQKLPENEQPEQPEQMPQMQQQAEMYSDMNNLQGRNLLSE